VRVPDWLLWLILAALLAVGEVLTLGFLLGLLALAAVAAGVVAALGGGIVLQLLVFIGASLASLAVLRPIAKRHLRTPTQLRTGTAALVGAKGVVTQRVDDLSGQVKIGGELWTARTFMEGEVIEPGARVEVAKIEGATALVYQ
jgi:membrane protein implicated in regulation of membrane protease activity